MVSLFFDRYGAGGIDGVPAAVGGNQPALLSDVTAASSASNITVWGLQSGNIASFVVNNMAPLHFGGFTCSTGTLRGYGGASSYTADSTATFNATDGRTGTEWSQQSLINSRGWVATAHAAGMKVYLGYHFFNALSTVNGNFMLPDVWDDAAWTAYLSHASDGVGVVNLYAAARWMGFDGIAWDMEPTSTNNGTVQSWLWNYTGNTHTQAQTRAQVKLRGAQYSTAVFGASGFPGADILFYADNSSSPSDANSLFGGGADSGPSADTDPREINDFLDGLSTVTGYGQITFVDPIFYKPNYLGGSSNFAGYAQFGQGHTMARVSQNYQRPDLLLPKFNVSPFEWFDIGTGGSEPEVGATDANVMAQAANRYGSNGMWALYQQHLWGAGGMDNPAQYSVKWPTALSNGSAVSTVDSTAITVGTVSQSRSGSTVTMTFTAAHPYQIRYVQWKLYAANGTTVTNSGVATMIYQANGGTAAAGFANAYVDCTAVVPNATAALYVTLDIYTCKGQRTSRRVQVS